MVGVGSPGDQSAVSAPYKFGTEGALSERFEYSYVWAREKTTGPDRLIIAPSNDQVSLILELSRLIRAPFWILYVLAVPRTELHPGRYQSTEPVERSGAEEFLYRFRRFFEGDGRHNLWLKSTSTADLLVYDKHNIIYAYGNLQVFEHALNAKGLKQATEVLFPFPHSHHYNSEFDEEEREVLLHWNWTRFDLQQNDEV